MEYLLTVLVILCVFLFVGCSNGKDSEQGRGQGQSAHSGPDSSQEGEKKMKPMNRAEVEKNLKKLAQTPPPTDLKQMGAMCYDMAGPSERAEYVCVKCGEKTLYTEFMTSAVEWEIPACRRRIQAITEISISLDESEFCKKCSPDVGKPRLALLVQYADENTKHRISGIQENDLKLLKEFLSGKQKHTTWNDAETPLKDEIPRLKELLGLPKSLSEK